MGLAQNNIRNSILRQATPKLVEVKRVIDLSLSSRTDTTLNFSWTAPTGSDNPISYYRIILNGTEIGTTTNTTYSFSGLTAGTNYSLYLVTVDNQNNESIPSNTVNTNTWFVVELPATAQTTANMEVVITDASNWHMDWGDGTVQTYASGPVYQTKTYGTAFTGVMKLMHPDLTKIYRFRSTSGAYDCSDMYKLTGLNYVEIRSDKHFGNVEWAVDLPDMTFLQLLGNGFYGNMSNANLLTLTTRLYLNSTGFYGNMSNAINTLPNTVYYYLIGNFTVNYVSRVFPPNMQIFLFRPTTATNPLGSSELDQILQDLSVTTWTGSKNIYLDQNNGNRTSASDAAVATLGTKGVMLYLNPKDTTSFITKWKTTTPSESITIPTTGTGYNYTIDFGDGTVLTGQTGNVTHTYAVAGTYTVKISGTFPQMYFNNGGDRLKIQSIEQWGTTSRSGVYQFTYYGCENLVANYTDRPNFANVTHVTNFFYDCKKFNGSLNGINVSGVLKFLSFFRGCTIFNQDISGWDVSSANDMGNMFRDALAFNQNISGWNVGNVTSMANMFRNATSFNQNLGGWNITKVTDMSNMFNGVTLSTANYDALLIGWAAQSVKTGVPFHAGNSKYSPAAVSARNVLISKGWTITDGGPA